MYLGQQWLSLVSLSMQKIGATTTLFYIHLGRQDGAFKALLETTLKIYIFLMKPIIYTIFGYLAGGIVIAGTSSILTVWFIYARNRRRDTAKLGRAAELLK